MPKNQYITESKLHVAFLHRLSDILMIPLAAALAHAYVYSTFALNNFLGLSVALSIMIAFWLYPNMGLYRAWRGSQSTKELSTAAQAWSINFLVLAFLLYFTNNANAEHTAFFGVWFISGLIGLLSLRAGIRVFLNKARILGRNKTHVVIVGDNGLATSTINTLRKVDWAGFNVVGHFGNGDIKGVTKLGSFHEISRYLENSEPQIDQIWIAMPLSREKEISQILEELRFATQDIRLVPGIDGFRLINHSATQVADMPVLDLQASPLKGINRLVKEVEDRTLAALILLAISPLMLALALGVKLSSKGPVFYRQERIGMGGKPFMMYKFRSMPVDIEQNGIQWGNAGQKATTRFGQFIRRTSLDELPQFINVLVGDMSIVGPRPERTQFVNEFKHDIDGYMQKHMVKAGITGWAQVNGWRGDTDLLKRIEHDLYYISNWSIFLDLKIILMTLFNRATHANAE